MLGILHWPAGRTNAAGTLCNDDGYQEINARYLPSCTLANWSFFCPVPDDCVLLSVRVLSLRTNLTGRQLETEAEVARVLA